MKMRVWLMLLFLLGGIGAFAAEAEFNVAFDGWGVSYSGTADVILKGRTFTAREWSGFCLPFDASKEVLDAALGEGNYSLQEYDSFADNVISFKKVTAATAGVPYFVYVKNYVENPKFVNVTFVSDVNLGYSGYMADYRGNIAVGTNLTFRGFYYKKASYQLFNSSPDQTISAYYLDGAGELLDLRNNEFSSDALGINASFLVTDYKKGTTQKPTIKFEDDDVVNSGASGGASGGGEESEDQSSLSYKIKNKLQLTDVPTVYIDVEGVGGTDADLDKALYKVRATGEAPYLNAVITVKDNGTDKDTKHLKEFTDKVKIKVRGNSTANPTNGKKAYRLKFDKKLGATKHDMLGLGYSARNWTLLANVFDHSMVRNALSYHLEKEVGMDFCPGYKFADVVINGNYRGTYQICDHVEIDKNRVNINEDTGWMLEFQGRGDMLDKPLCFTQNGLQMNIKNPEPANENDAAQVAAVIAPIQDWFVNTWAPKWQSTDAYGEKTGWRSVNDEESLIKFWIITELTGDYDGWMTAKAYKEAGEDKLHYGPVWDKDLAYGNYTGEKSDLLISNNGNGSSLVTYLNDNLLKDPKFTAKAQARLQTLLNGGLIDRLCSKADELAAIVAKTEELSNTKFPRSMKVGDETNNYETYQETVTKLKEYLRTRFAKVKKLSDEVKTEANTKIANVTYTPTNEWYSTGLYGKTGKLTDVIVDNRTYKANQWNTFCLPFDLTIEQLKTAFGNDVEIVDHVGMDLDGKTMLFAPVTDATLYGGFPYFIKPTSEVSNPKFTDVIITQSPIQNENYNGQYISFDNKHYIYGTLFKGYNIGVVSGESDYLFKDDDYESDASMTTFALKYGGNGTKYENGARAFLRIPDNESPSIKILSADEAKKFNYDVTNSYVHTAWCQYDNEIKNVTIANRGTLWGNEWNMICLPFKLASDAYKKVFGDDVKVAEFTGVTKSEGGEVLSFDLAYINEKNGMKAATPYLIFPSKDIPTDGLKFEGVKVSVKTTAEQATGNTDFRLIGTLEPTALTKGNQQIVLMRSNQLKYMASGTTTPMQACRAYFEAVSGTDVTSAKAFKFSIDGVSTDVKLVEMNGSPINADAKIYNLNGQQVGKSTDRLSHGIYIVAGKKVVR